MLLLVLFFFPMSSMTPQIPETHQRLHFTDGNQLLAWCNAAQKAIEVNDRGFSVKTRDGAKAFAAGRCYGFIIGVVQTMPAGEDFSPGPTVRTSQYLDVVTAYLKANPHIRDNGAASLTESALVEAFPKKR
jgi:hypothetical protein